MIDLKVGDRVMLLKFKWGKWSHIFNCTVQEVTERKVFVTSCLGNYWCLINRFTGEVMDSSYGINRWEKITNE